MKEASRKPARILIVEDEPKLSSLLKEYLEREGYAARTLADGSRALEEVRDYAPDLMLLDLMLPGKGGLDICRELRAFSNLPVIMITARVEEIDRLLGLELGADDYICKPFSLREVVARVKALLRRVRSHAAEPPGLRPPEKLTPAKEGQGVVVNMEGYQAWYHGQALDLTPAEFRLLSLFAEKPGRVFSREQLLEGLHEDNRIVTDRTIDTHIKNLRRKLSQVDPEHACITSIYGVGYRFDL